MGHHVTIEGSLTPTDRLARGVRRTVPVTDEIRKLVKIGGAIVVEGSLDPPAAPVPGEQESPGDGVPKAGTEVPLGETAELVGEDTGGPYEVLPPLPESAYPADAAPLELPEPPKNAKREVWADFLRSKGISFPDGDESKGELWAGRDDLIIIWQQASGGS